MADASPYVDAFHTSAGSAAAVDPNTGLPAASNAVNPQANGTRADQSNAYLDAWAENPTANPPTRTWVDPAARPTALPNGTQVQQFLRDHQGMTDAEIAQNMQRYGVSPEAFAADTGMDAGQVSQRYQAATGAAWNPKFSDDYLAAWHDTPTTELNSTGLPADNSTTSAPAPAPSPAPAPTPAPVGAPPPAASADAGPKFEDFWAQSNGGGENDSHVY